MTSFERVWKMLSKRRLEVDENSLNRVSCVICENLVNNAHNGPCECIFCKKCIETYLTEGPKYCPTDSEKCKEKKLVINKNVVKNDKVNSQVVKTVVKCPSYQCDYECKLVKMCDHVKTCDKEEICCPFSEIGCEAIMKRKKIAAHLQSEIYKHNKLIVRWTTNCEKAMKEDVENKLQKMNEQAEVSTSLLSTTFTEEIKKHKDDIALLVNDLAVVKEQNKEFAKIISRLQSKLNEQSLEILELKRLSPVDKTEIFANCVNREKLRRNSIQVAGVRISKTKSHTFNEGHPTVLNGSDKELSKKRSKTFISANGEQSSLRKKGDKKWSEFLHSFN